MFLYEVPVHLVTEYWVGGVVGLDPVKKKSRIRILQCPGLV